MKKTEQLAVITLFGLLKHGEEKHKTHYMQVAGPEIM